MTKIVARRPRSRGSIPGNGTDYSGPYPVSNSIGSSSHDIRMEAVGSFAGILFNARPEMR